MSLKELRIAVVERIGEAVAAHGFKLRRAERACYRKVPGGVNVLRLPIASYGTHFTIVAQASVRLDAVMAFIAAHPTPLVDAGSKSATTFGIELGNHALGHWASHRVYDAVDVAPVAEAIVDGVERYGLPYWQTYSDPEAAYDLLSFDHPRVSLHCPSAGARATIVVALAMLLGKHAELPAIVRRWERALIGDVAESGFRQFLLANGLPVTPQWSDGDDLPLDLPRIP